VPEGSLEEARATLERQVVPRVKESPGFIAGYWIAPENGEGMSVIVFDTEEHAQAASRGLQPPPQVELINASVREVVASA
jgi:hypothetical protein